MDHRHLGRSGLLVSPLCLGTMNFGANTSDEDAFAIMDAALEAGINFFDTADMYSLGVSEEILGRAMKDMARRDAVVIATPDHWHALGCLHAARANKDIYCEKPLTHSIREGRMIADAVREHNVIFQTGSQQRSEFDNRFRRAVELIWNGKLGQLKSVRVGVGGPPVPCDLPEAEAPPDVDWDRWLGPCPWRPYNSLYVQGRWRGYFDFHGGGILEWGSHTADLCQWVNDADETTPIEFEPHGIDRDTPYSVECRYANGMKLVLRDSGFLDLGACIVRFEGDGGWIETGDSGKIAASPGVSEGHREFADSRDATTNHVRDFLNCVKSRKQPRANALAACQAHIACHAAYIAFQLGRKLKFDPATDTFVGDDEANRMRSRAMREPWRLV